MLRVSFAGNREPGFEVNIISLAICKTEGLPDSCEITITDSEGLWRESPLFEPETSMAVQIEQGRNLNEAFSGEVCGAEFAYTTISPARLTIRGYDLSHRLQERSRTRSFVGMRISEICAQIAAEYGFEADIEATEEVFPILTQAGSSDWDFLQEKIRQAGRALSFRNNTVLSTRESGTSVRTLTFGKGLLEFHSIKSFPTRGVAVRVRGWDFEAKETMIGFAELPDDGAGGKGKTLREFFLSTSNQSQADYLAKELCGEMKARRSDASFVLEGFLDLSHGDSVKVEGAGERFGGDYRVTEVRYEFNATDGLRTNLVAQNRDLTSQSLNRIRDCYPEARSAPGIVVDLEDPLRIGRARVGFSWLSDRETSGWARVIVQSSTLGAELYLKIGDEVYVGFEGGDLDRPIILGRIIGSRNPS